MGKAVAIEASQRFSREVREIPRSRRFVAQVLADHGRTATDAVLLVTSELITNAVRYGAGEVELRVVLDGPCVTLEVLDDGRTSVRAPDTAPPPSSLGGRGLLLVREVSSRWGSDLTSDGRTCVWAELPVT